MEWWVGSGENDKTHPLAIWLQAKLYQFPFDIRECEQREGERESRGTTWQHLSSFGVSTSCLFGIDSDYYYYFRSFSPIFFIFSHFSLRNNLVQVIWRDIFKVFVASYYLFIQWMYSQFVHIRHVNPSFQFRNTFTLNTKNMEIVVAPSNSYSFSIRSMGRFHIISIDVLVTHFIASPPHPPSYYPISRTRATTSRR